MLKGKREKFNFMKELIDLVLNFVLELLNTRFFNSFCMKPSIKLFYYTKQFQFIWQKFFCNLVEFGIDWNIIQNSKEMEINFMSKDLA